MAKRGLLPLSALLGLLALAAHALALATSGELRLWATNVGWTLAALVALSGTLLAALRVPAGRVGVASRLWACAAGSWLAGALVRDGLALVGIAFVPSAADPFWLLFALLAVAGLAYRSPPGALSFRLFLLDALPVVLLATALVRVAEGHALDQRAGGQLALSLYPALYVLLSLIAVQLTAMHGLRSVRSNVGLLALGFCLTAVGAVAWSAQVLGRDVAQGHWSDPLWSAGLLVVGGAGFRRALSPAAFPRLRPPARESGVRALPPAGAVFALAALPLVVPDHYDNVLYGFALAAIVLLAARFYLARRATGRLVDELVRSREALRESERRFRSIFESAAIGTSVANLEARLTETNHAFARMFGYRREELRGMAVADITHPDESSEALELLQELVEGRRDSYQIEKRYVRKDGSAFWGRVTASLVRDAQGEPELLIGMVEDIEERKRVEAALRDSEQRFRSLVANVPGAIYRCAADADWTMEFISEEIEVISGYPASDFIRNSTRTYESIIHPDDRRMVEEIVHACVGERRPYVLEFRLIAADGDVRWVYDKGQGVFGSGGELLFLDGAIFDVTERKRAERSVRESERRFRALLESAPDSVVITDAGGRIVLANAQTERLFGYERGELVGQPVEMLLPERAGGVHSGRRAAYLADPQARPMGVGRQLAGRRKNGSEFPVEISLSPLQTEEGLLVIAAVRDDTERKRLEEELRHQAFHDSLTGLANRALFGDRVEHALARGQRTNASVAVLFIDIDDFKTVNDSLGHSAGDRLLVAIGKRLRACLRPAETCARVGGDEFAVLLEDVPDLRAAVRVAERVLNALEAPFSLHGEQAFLHASIGIAAGGSDEDASELLRNADIAMYRAKAEGKGGYAVFEPTMLAAVRARSELTAELQQALESKQFTLFYQPILDLGSGVIAGVEALLRWRHPKRGLVCPGEFIALAEETGLIVPLSRWVLREACRQGHLWQVHYPCDPPLTMSVNLSGRHLLERAFVADVARALEQSGFPPQSLILELTESVLVDSPEGAQKLRELKKLGVQLAIDDFGSGYSSLDYLRRLPIDILKMDRPFVQTIGRDANERRFAATIIGLGKGLGLQVVAEGIERADQHEQLRDVGCQLGQGFLFAPPLDHEELEALLGRQAEESARPLAARRG